MSKISVTTIAGLTSGGDANKVKIESGDDLEVVSGDLTVDTSTLKVDSSNNRVGIGTATPSYLLKVGPVNQTETIAVQSAGGGAETIMQSYQGTDSRIGSSANTPLNLLTNNVSRMTIDTGGRISMPNVPRFLARKNASSWTVSANAIMVWDSTSIAAGYNVGSHYNTSTGQFTCPVAGTYHFEATSIVNSTVSNGYWAIRKNGSTIMEQHISQSNTSWHAHRISITNEFAANDTVEVYLGSAPTGWYGQQWSYFHGRMIG